nr:hypothetical protein [Tanacetum cinerariifolium]
MSTITYVEIFTHLRAYEEHALKSRKKKEQSSAVVDPLAYLAKTTPTHSTTSPITVPTPQSSGDSHNDAMLATKNQIANLLSGLQKQFPPTNNQLRTSSNPKTHVTTTGSGVNNSGKKVICYNCRGEGHVARQCKEPKRAYDSQWYHDKALLMQAMEKGGVLDAEAEAFLADVESFMANLSSTGGINSSSSSHINEVQISDDSFFSDVSYPLAQEMQQEEHLNSEVDSVLDDNIITVNDEHKLVNETLTAELERRLGYSNPRYGKQARIAQPALYDGHVLLNLNHPPTRVHDSEEALVHAEV